MNTCAFEIHINGQWKECCTVEIDKPTLGGADTTGLQGMAPKFMLTLGKDDLFYLDGAIPDFHAKKHYLVKLPRGRDPSDLKIHKNEASFQLKELR